MRRCARFSSPSSEMIPSSSAAILLAMLASSRSSVHFSNGSSSGYSASTSTLSSNAWAPDMVGETHGVDTQSALRSERFEKFYVACWEDHTAWR